MRLLHSNMTNGKYQIPLAIFGLTIVFGAGTLVGTVALRDDGHEKRLGQVEARFREDDQIRTTLITNVAVLTVQVVELSKKIDQLQLIVVETRNRVLRIQ